MGQYNIVREAGRREKEERGKAEKKLLRRRRWWGGVCEEGDWEKMGKRKRRQRLSREK